VTLSTLVGISLRPSIVLLIYKTASRISIAKIKGNLITRIPAISELKGILPTIAIFIRRFLIKISLFFKIFIKRLIDGFYRSIKGRL
jgi:hypothetical protein